MRSAGCHLPSLASLAEKEAYAKVAMESSKVMEAFNEYVVVMEDHVVASRNEKDIESIGSEIKRLSKELEATKREGKKDAEKIEALTEDWRRIYLENEALMTQMKTSCFLVRLSPSKHSLFRWTCASYQATFRNPFFAGLVHHIKQQLKSGSIKRLSAPCMVNHGCSKGKNRDARGRERSTSKKKEVSVEIQLQEVIANIDLLNELKDGGLTVDAELARLKEMEGDCENFVASAAVPDWSISKLDLPQVG
ncbi:hypothetical protein F2Q69_00036376 [Brassica cretica]|uniref:Uncharacterized protein n=1 Tax=Brassica cretica TaxID=69181 RepID=A0A8S9SNZ8_BRACR|nr:hypothetical protein F2Q69_00036376 [Brassica cretica]